MDNHRTSLSRREFLTAAALGVGAFALRPLTGKARSLNLQLPDFPVAEKLGRVAKGRWDVKARPDPDSQTTTVVYEDAVFPWIKEVMGEKPTWTFTNQRWVETPDGYIYGAFIQPVFNKPNPPISSLRESSHGTGTWMEVTVPYVDVTLERDASTNSWLKARQEEGLPLRLYYSQVFWVDRIKEEGGQVWYHINPNYYGGVDMFWVPSEALHPLSDEELSPISPDAADKRVVVDVLHQVLSCYEGNSEVFYTRVATGAKFDMYGNAVDKWATPIGVHKVTRKYISLQMSGGATGAGYDLPGIGWSAIFATGGVAIHSTFWHNNYGDPMSHGCVNVSPEDARWIFRWLLPTVSYDPGMIDTTVTGEASTIVEVKEG